MNKLLLFFTFTVFIIFILTAIISFFEKEYQAFKRALLFSILFPIPFIIILTLNIYILSIGVLVFMSLILVAMLLPITIKKKSSSINPDSQIDERDIMFSRQKLTGKHFKQYYKNNPGKKSFDDRFRKNPGLLDNNAIYYSCFSSEAAKANFDVTQHLREITHPPIKKNSHNTSEK